MYEWAFDAAKQAGYAIGSNFDGGAECEVFHAWRDGGRYVLKIRRARTEEWVAEWGTRPFDNPILDIWRKGGAVAYIQFYAPPAEWADACNLAAEIARLGYRTCDWGSCQCGWLTDGRAVLNDYSCAVRRVIPPPPAPEDRKVYCQILVRG